MFSSSELADSCSGLDDPLFPVPLWEADEDARAKQLDAILAKACYFPDNRGLAVLVKKEGGPSCSRRGTDLRRIKAPRAPSPPAYGFSPCFGHKNSFTAMVG